MAKKQAEPTATEPISKPEVAESLPTVQETKAVSGIPETYNPEEWGQAQLTSRDVVIPRILLMQPMSPQVTDGKAAFGEFRESLNEEKLGKFDESFDVVPFWMEKVWVESQLIPAQKAGQPPEKKWFRTIPVTPANENLPSEGDSLDMSTGEMVNVVRDRVMNFYVLLANELNLGGAIPYVLPFRRTSMQAGKKLATQMYMKNINAGKSPASMVMSVFSKKESATINGQSVTYAVADIKPSGWAKPEHVADAFKWLQIMKSGKAKVHDESYAKEEATKEQPAPMPQEGTGNF